MGNYLVTGAAGFIGARTSELLIKDGHTVVGIDNLNEAYDPRMKEYRLQRLQSMDGFSFHKLDISDKSIIDQFKTQKELLASIKTFNGEAYSGKIVFDLDEEFDFELLQGKLHEFEYSTPFRNVKKIKQHDDSRCEIELKNGQKIMLSDGQDVDGRNQGVLVYAQGKGDPKYVPWDKVSEIEFR